MLNRSNYDPRSAPSFVQGHPVQVRVGILVQSIANFQLATMVLEGLGPTWVQNCAGLWHGLLASDELAWPPVGTQFEHTNSHQRWIISQVYTPNPIQFWIWSKENLASRCAFCECQGCPLPSGHSPQFLCFHLSSGRRSIPRSATLCEAKKPINPLQISARQSNTPTSNQFQSVLHFLPPLLIIFPPHIHIQSLQPMIQSGIFTRPSPPSFLIHFHSVSVGFHALRMPSGYIG